MACLSLFESTFVCRAHPGVRRLYENYGEYYGNRVNPRAVGQSWICDSYQYSWQEDTLPSPFPGQRQPWPKKGLDWVERRNVREMASSPSPYSLAFSLSLPRSSPSLSSSLVTWLLCAEGIDETTTTSTKTKTMGPTRVREVAIVPRHRGSSPRSPNRWRWRGLSSG